MTFQTVWFLLIAVLWIGYFVLEGFDFGVGMLLPTVSKNEADRRAVLTTLGPVWDGNEVWLLVAGGATFAAFPEWYATLFSGFYLPLFLILVALIIRGVAFEYRSKYGKAQWRQRWDVAIVISSALPALLWGVAFANIVRGVPLEKASSGSIEGALARSSTSSQSICRRRERLCLASSSAPAISVAVPSFSAKTFTASFSESSILFNFEKASARAE